MNSRQVVERHQASGRPFSAAGVASFLLDAGTGVPVVCLHGVPASSFLYASWRPSWPGVAYAGSRFDLPGLGLSERPEDLDYT